MVLYVEGSSVVTAHHFLLISHTVINLRPKNKSAALLLYTCTYSGLEWKTKAPIGDDLAALLFPFIENTDECGSFVPAKGSTAELFLFFLQFVLLSSPTKKHCKGVCKRIAMLMLNALYFTHCWTAQF